MRGIQILILLSAVLLSACSLGTTEAGVLHGKVKIGPIQPVEQPGVTPTVPPEVFRARKVLVFDKSGDKLVERIDIGDDGCYSIKLEPGTYVVDINRVGIDSSGDVPKEITIISGLTVRLDIDVDTGIR
ncbi:hypothetical protein ACFLWX_00625 [Chloroflexota bacterium]